MSQSSSSRAPHAAHRFSPLQDVWFPSALLREGVLANYLEFAEVLRTRDFDATQWEKYRSKRLREVLARVSSASPFYQSRLGALNVERIAPDGLGHLPFTTREDLARYCKAAYARPLASGGVCHMVRGNGAAVAAPSSWLELLASSLSMAANLADCMKRHVLPRDPVAAVLPGPESEGVIDNYCDALRNLSIAHVRCAPADAATTQDLLEELGANVVIGSAAALAELGVERAARTTPATPVGLLLVTGSAPSPALLDGVSQAFGGVPCFALAYALPETLIVASTCGFGNRHLAMQNYVAEVLDPATGQAVAPQAAGELVLTSLLPGIRPLVRFRTGDVVSLRAGDCACGSSADILVAHGRLADAVFLNGRRWWPRELEQAIVACTQRTHGYQVCVTMQDAKDVLLLEFDAPLVANARAAEAALEELVGGAVRIVPRSLATAMRAWQAGTREQRFEQRRSDESHIDLARAGRPRRAEEPCGDGLHVEDRR